MEYVEGSTLGSVLSRGQLAIDHVQRFAVQIAEAVGRAHRAGIVHRDLKPGNIMITNDGRVFLSDLSFSSTGC